jgi:UDP-2,3-diacylglucosamine pyrophosphatase LpxH
MLFFLSDLHMTDTGVGGAVTDQQLMGLIADLERYGSKDKPEKHKLVFVGDIFDLLRSPKWARLWDEKKSAPWSGSSPNFKHFHKSFAQPQAVEIAETIAHRYSKFGEALKRLVDQGRLDVVYVPGNHDYMFQLSPGLRKVLIDFLSLKHDPNREFQISFTDHDASIFATHGNSFDPANWHRREPGYWAIGDAVVLRVVNPFAEKVCARIGVPVDGELGTALQDIDNIEPLADIPLWVLWASETNLSIKSSREDVLAVWKQVVDEFLELKEFRDKHAYGAPEYQRLRYAFELSTKVGLADLLSGLAAKFQNLATDYRAHAESEARKYKQYRFVVFGHTHKPRLDPLAHVHENKNTYYVNTGCWRRLVARIPGSGPVMFAGRRVATYFVVDDAGTMEPEERYHLYQQWHVS